MIYRAVYIFPDFNNTGKIENIRRIYDSDYKNIRPHIVILPIFKSNLTKNEMHKLLLDAIQGINPFLITARSISYASDNCLYLQIKKGNDELILIRDLVGFFMPNEIDISSELYIPGICIGRFTNSEDTLFAAKSLREFNFTFEVRISSISSYIVEDHGKVIREELRIQL